MLDINGGIVVDLFYFVEFTSLHKIIVELKFTPTVEYCTLPPTHEAKQW